MAHSFFAWLGVLIALAVAVIGYFQWLTAHQRLVLDLFERRFETREQIMKVVTAYTPIFQVTQETLSLFINAQERAKFLFGKKVLAFLEDRYKDLLTL